MSANLLHPAETTVSYTDSLADAVAAAPWRQTHVWDLDRPSTVLSDVASQPMRRDRKRDLGNNATRSVDLAHLVPCPPPLEGRSSAHDYPETPQVSISGFDGQYAGSIGIAANRTVEILVDVKYPTTPIDLYNHMFDSDFFVEFLTESQGAWDLQFEEWRHREDDPNLLMRDFQYKRPNSGVGPKEVYCQEHEENQHRDENDYIESETTTHTPDVPYGKSFYVVTHTKINWAENRDEGCVLNIVLEIIWTGWCPFKGIVEGRIIDGQKQYSADLDAAVRKELASVKTGPRRHPPQQARVARPAAAGTINASQKQTWNWKVAQEKPQPRPVRFDDTTSMLSSDEEKHVVSLSGIGAESDHYDDNDNEKHHHHQLESSLYHARRQYRLRLAILLALVSVALTLIIFRLFQ